MNISLLDPGLVALAGHHFDQAFRLALALKQMGHSVQVHCHQSTDKEVEIAFSRIGIYITRTFRVYTYEPPTSGKDDLDYWLERSRETEEDLRALPPTEIAFWPCPSPFQLLALARQPHGRRVLAGFDGNINEFTSWGAQLISHGAQLVRKAQDRIVLGAYDWRMTDIYAPLLHGIGVVRFPVPYDQCPLGVQRRDTLATIGFFGHQRAERGTDLLPELISTLISQGKSVIFQDSGNYINVEGADPGLTVLGFVDDIAAHIAICDLVVWPSDSSGYAARTSGIVWSAIACGKPIVLPAVCLPARIAHERGAAVTYRHNSIPNILDSIRHADENYAVLINHATQKAIEWAETEGVNQLASAIANVRFPPWSKPMA